MAALSSDSQWLAFRDREGVKLSQRPFDSAQRIADSNPIWGYGLAFSHDNRSLAYTDGEGLKVYDVLTVESRLLKLSQHSTEEICENVVYSPYRWSPDDRWLVIRVQPCEGFGLVLAHIPTGRFHDFTHCGGDIEWSIPSDLVVGVSYWGQAGCGERDGVFILSARSNRFTEKRIYNDPIPVNPWDRETFYANWSPKGNWISFVQGSYVNDDDGGYDRLMVIRPDGSDMRALVVSKGNIETPFWLPGEDRIFYVVQDSHLEESRIFSVDVETLEQQDYGILEDHASIVAASPGSEWLILSLSHWSVPLSRLNRIPFILINVVNGMNVKISQTVENTKGSSQVSFIAWE